MVQGNGEIGKPDKQTKLSQSEVPYTTLESALRVAQGLWDQFAGKSAAPHDIALALDVSPTSSAWRRLTGAAVAYGLTQGAYNANEIALTELGRRIVAPTEEGADAAAKFEAVLKPRVLRDFFQKYDRAKFPREDIGRNVLAALGVPKDRVDRAFEIIVENGKFVGAIRDTKTGPFVALSTVGSAPVRETEEEARDDADLETPLAPAAAPSEREAAPPAAAVQPARPKQLFVAHGKNHKPLDDLKKILNEFKIPYKVAVDEPHKGRPISAKVAELMNECSAGIFIFTKDERFFANGKDGHEEIWRPSENVVYELGAANILWDRKIIIVREEGVNFPSDFSDLGYITFKDGEISTKALEILKELVALELVRFSAA
jgi:predicted nucleotide-binding protein